jgi:hypothetical protein
MSVYLTTSSDYAAAREGSINAAIDYFGLCSNEYQQVMNAWATVGVGTPAPSPCIEPLVTDIWGPTISNCGNTEYWSTYPTGGNGTYSYEWYINGTLVSTSDNLSYRFEEGVSGDFYISLTVTDGDQTIYDDIYVYVYCNGMYSAQTELSLLLYPNPASKVTILEIDENKDLKSELMNKDCNIYIYDKNGRILKNIKSKNRRHELDVSYLKD